MIELSRQSHFCLLCTCTLRSTAHFGCVPHNHLLNHCGLMQIQKLSAHIRPSSAQRGPSQSKPPVTAPAVVMQHSPPSSRDGSMHQQRQLASAAAARGCSGENRHDEMPGRNTSLAVSVANTMNLQARPTSTQEGAETPIAASDDDTIEMHAQVLSNSTCNLCLLNIRRLVAVSQTPLAPGHRNLLLCIDVLHTIVLVQYLANFMYCSILQYLQYATADLCAASRSECSDTYSGG